VSTSTAPTATVTTTPDLSRYRMVHQALRASDDRLVAGISRLAAGDRRQARALRRWFAGYAGELRSHHAVEDDLFFPALAARVPAYATDYAELLTADHHQVDDVLAALTASLDRLAGGHSPWSFVQDEALGHALTLRDLLHEHLDVEDRDVLPLFERHLTAAEYHELDQEAVRRIAFRQLFFTVPWWIATIDPAAVPGELAGAPTPLRVIWRLTRRRHARLVRRAFGPIAA
jgi:hemerythrin-like domain-containing protein